jgi:hypothetical protein
VVCSGKERSGAGWFRHLDRDGLMNEIPVIIVTDEKADLAAVQEACQVIGLKNIKLVPGLRMLHGFIEADRKEKLSNVPGVLSVEVERIVRRLV